MDQIEIDFAQILPVVQGVVRTYVDNEEDAKDTVQNALTRLWMQGDKLPADSTRLKGYAYTVARTAAFDHFRNYKRSCRYRDYNAVVSTIVDLWREESGCRARVLVSNDDQEQRDLFLHKQVREAVNRLPKLQKQALLMQAHGFSYQEIADRQGASVGTIRSRLHYARKQTRELLAPYLSSNA